MDVVALAPGDTHPLRQAILRAGTPSDEIAFDGDDEPTTFHLGVRDGERIVAISTWLLRPHPSLELGPTRQLRGMAVAAELQGSGMGGVLLEAGIERSREEGLDHVWARARVPALDFYRRHGFDSIGEEYLSEATGIPHVDIVRRLA